MTVTGERPKIELDDVDFNRRDHPDRPLRPIPPGRDHFADQWRYMREFMFGEWIDIDKEVEPNEITRLRDDYFWQGDEYMVGVVDAFERLGYETGRALFEQALTRGIDTVEDPPQSFVDFFEHLDQLASQFDLEAAERGRMLAMSSTVAATAIIRGWAFYETAMTGDISAATGATGRFADDGPRRFIETARVFAEFTLPEIFDRHSEAFQDVVRVRLMHGLASRGLRRKWGDDVYLKFGEPIPVTSLLGFGSGMLLSRLVDHAFGRKMTRQELEDLAEYSSFSGRLWGAPVRLHSADGLELIKSLNYVLARGGNPSPWRAQLVDAIAGPAHLSTLTQTSPVGPGSWWPGTPTSSRPASRWSRRAWYSATSRLRRWSRAAFLSRWATTTNAGCRCSATSPSSTSVSPGWPTGCRGPTPSGNAGRRAARPRASGSPHWTRSPV